MRTTTAVLCPLPLLHLQDQHQPQCQTGISPPPPLMRQLPPPPPLRQLPPHPHPHGILRQCPDHSHYIPVCPSSISNDNDVHSTSPRAPTPPTTEQPAGTDSMVRRMDPAGNHMMAVQEIKFHVRNIFHESLCTGHDPAARWTSSACNIPGKWELFTAIGLVPPAEEMRETNYPSSYNYQPIPSKLPSSPSLQVIGKHHLEDGVEQNESPKRNKVILRKDEDIIDKFLADEELQEILNKKTSF